MCGKENNMFDKVIVDVWIDMDTFTKYLISVDDNGTLFLSEQNPKVIK